MNKIFPGAVPAQSHNMCDSARLGQRFRVIPGRRGRAPGRRVEAMSVVPDSATVESANLADHVRRAAAGNPDRPALLHSDRVVRWRELDVAVDAVAARLRSLRLPAEAGYPARVAVALPNVPEFAAVFFGVLRAGLVAVPVNPEYTHRELAHVLDDCAAAALVATPDVVATAGAAAPRSTYPVASAADLDALARPDDRPARPGGAAPPATGGEDLAVLLYTAGTSGPPKGAMLPHRALIANHVQLAQLGVAGPDDTLLLALPLFHAYGLNAGLGALAYHGATGVLVDEFSAGGTRDLIARHQVTVVAGVPGMFAAWAAAGEAEPEAFRTALRSLRIAVSGAAPLPPAVADRFAAVSGVPVQIGYGLTETAPVLTTTLAGPTCKPGSIGRPLPGVGLRLVGVEAVEGPEEEEAEYGIELESPESPGTDPGEMEVRGPNLFLGYWPDGAGGPGPDGWWATGDVAYADEDGELFLVDRIGELILVSGFNVYPYEIEQVLVDHPGVAEAAVIGVPHEVTGQTVRAFVVPAPDVAATTADLAAHCATQLARFKCPTSIEIVPELPHSAAGKVRKSVLRKW